MIIGLALIFLGVIFIIVSTILNSNNKDVKYSVVGIFGFIPFGFSNDKKLFTISLVVGFVLILVMLFIFFTTNK